MTQPVRINIRSISHLFPGQGVASAFREHCALARKLPADRFSVRVNSFRRADIVHCHSVEPWNLFYMRFMCRRSVMHCHFLPETLKGSLRLPRLISYLFDRYVLHFYKAADRLVVVNPSFIPKLVELGIDENKIVYIPNYVSLDGFYPYSEDERRVAREKLNIPENTFAVMGAGQIMARKGVDDFLSLAREMPDVLFIWCGGFPFGVMTDGYGKWKAAVKNPPRNVRFPGLIPRKDMNAYYNACDLFLLPSVDELFPMCILEAAAAGRPFLVRDLSLYEDILPAGYAKAADVEGFIRQIGLIRYNPACSASAKQCSSELCTLYSGQAILTRLSRLYEI